MCPGHRGKHCSVNTEQSAAYCTVRRPPSHHHIITTLGAVYPGPLLRPVELRPAPRPRPRRVSAHPAPVWSPLHPAGGGGGALRVRGTGGATLVIYWSDEGALYVARSAAGSCTLSSSWSVGGSGRATTWTPPVSLVSVLTLSPSSPSHYRQYAQVCPAPPPPPPPWPPVLLSTLSPGARVIFRSRVTSAPTEARCRDKDFII